MATRAPVKSQKTATRKRAAGGRRRVAQGDVQAGATARETRANTVADSTRGRLDAEAIAFAADVVGTDKAGRSERARLLLDGISADDRRELLKLLREEKTRAEKQRPDGFDPDTVLVDNWQEGGYPYKYLMTRRNYE